MQTCIRHPVCAPWDAQLDAIGYRPKRRVEDRLVTLVVDGVSVSRAVLNKRF